MRSNKTSRIFAEYKGRLLSFVRKRLHSADDAEDIVQEVFYQLAKMDSQARPVEQTGAWLFRVAKNLIINWRNKKKDASFPVAYDDDGETWLADFADILFDTEVTPESEYLRQLVWEEIQAAVEELPEAQRDVFELTELYDTPVKEIAEMTKTPVNTVLSRKHYAVKHLRKRLKELYADVMGNFTQ